MNKASIPGSQSWSKEQKEQWKKYQARYQYFKDKRGMTETEAMEKAGQGGKWTPPRLGEPLDKTETPAISPELAAKHQRQNEWARRKRAQRQQAMLNGESVNLVFTCLRCGCRHYIAGGAHE
jgi:hypothetical protein